MEQVFFTREYIRENYVYFIVPGVFHVFPLLPLPRKGKNVALSLHHQRIRGFLRCNRIQRKWKFIVHASRRARNNILPVSGGFPSPLSLSFLEVVGKRARGRAKFNFCSPSNYFRGNSSCIAQLFQPIIR